MIGFDNGPPDGDYARYIDALMTQRAASLAAATMTSSDDVADRRPASAGRRNPMSPPTFRPSDERSRDALRGTGSGAMDTVAGTRVSAAPYAAAQSSMDVSQGATGLSPMATAAIASAMMVPASDRPQVPFANAGAIALVAGVALILMGILGSTSNVLFIVAGIALVSWGTKRLGKAIVPRVEAPAADRFAAATTHRASSRTRKKD